MSSKVVPGVQPPFKLERYFAKYEFSGPDAQSAEYTATHGINNYLMLSTSDPESVTMKELLELTDEETKNLWLELSLGYTETRGHPLLLKEVAKLHGLKAENILVAAPQELIYLATKTLANVYSKKYPDSGVHVVTTFPSYQSLYQNLDTFGCEVDHWRASYNQEMNTWQFYIDDLVKVLKENTRILVINFPHNPTGYLPTDEDFHKLIDICRKRNIFLFSDEMYRLTNNDGSEPFPSIAQLYENSLSLFGLSKTFGLPGLRIGWIASQDTDLLLEIETLKDYVTMCSSAPSEILAIIALKNKDVLIKRTMSYLQKNLEALSVFMKKHRDHFSWSPPRACTTSFIQLKEPLLKLGKSGTAEGFCDIIRKEAGILALPASLYDYSDKFIRLGFGRANLPVALSVLDEFLSKRF